jgi:hypothetical protein
MYGIVAMIAVKSSEVWVPGKSYARNPVVVRAKIFSLIFLPRLLLFYEENSLYFPHWQTRRYPRFDVCCQSGYRAAKQLFPRCQGGCLGCVVDSETAGGPISGPVATDTDSVKTSKEF